MITIVDVAKVCHEVNRAYCESLGDESQQPWEKANEWQKLSAIKGVEYRVNNPRASVSAQHTAWLEDKLRDGWVCGPKKDPAKKEHPCIVPYNELPLQQQAKDALFVAVVDSLRFHLRS